MNLIEKFHLYHSSAKFHGMIEYANYTPAEVILPTSVLDMTKWNWKYSYEALGDVEYPSFPLLPSLLWSRVIVHVRVPSLL